MRILVVEDEPKVAEFLQQGLMESGYSVSIASDHASAQRMFQELVPDLILLDRILPDSDGLETCRAIRRAGGNMPILLLTALGTTEDKVIGLDAGADDYLVKPFKFQELLARIRSLLRRRGPSPPYATEPLRYDDLELNVLRKEAVRNGKRIPLTVKEFALLEYLMRNPDRVLTRTMISEQVWDIAFDTGTNMVEAYVKLLRRKIDRDFGTKLIRTKVGHGYILTNGQ
jgi:DNA-binding response OmpR family regulator